jgi:hypothetical protein
MNMAASVRSFIHVTSVKRREAFHLVTENMFFAEAQRENGLKRSREIVRHNVYGCFCSLVNDKRVKR